MIGHYVISHLSQRKLVQKLLGLVGDAETELWWLRHYLQVSATVLSSYQDLVSTEALGIEIGIQSLHEKTIFVHTVKFTIITTPHSL